MRGRCPLGPVPQPRPRAHAGIKVRFQPFPLQCRFSSRAPKSGGTVCYRSPRLPTVCVISTHPVSLAVASLSRRATCAWRAGKLCKLARWNALDLAGLGDTESGELREARFCSLGEGASPDLRAPGTAGVGIAGRTPDLCPEAGAAGGPRHRAQKMVPGRPG